MWVNSHNLGREKKSISKCKSAVDLNYKGAISSKAKLLLHHGMTSVVFKMLIFKCLYQHLNHKPAAN